MGVWTRQRVPALLHQRIPLRRPVNPALVERPDHGDDAPDLPSDVRQRLVVAAFLLAELRGEFLQDFDLRRSVVVPVFRVRDRRHPPRPRPAEDHASQPPPCGVPDAGRGVGHREWAAADVPVEVGKDVAGDLADAQGPFLRTRRVREDVVEVEIPRGLELFLVAEEIREEERGVAVEVALDPLDPVDGAALEGGEGADQVVDEAVLVGHEEVDEDPGDVPVDPAEILRAGLEDLGHGRHRAGGLELSQPVDHRGPGLCLRGLDLPVGPGKVGGESLVEPGRGAGPEDMAVEQV